MVGLQIGSPQRNVKRMHRAVCDDRCLTSGKSYTRKLCITNAADLLGPGKRRNRVRLSRRTPTYQSCGTLDACGLCFMTNDNIKAGGQRWERRKEIRKLILTTS
jgi:hypothetical protein